MKKDILTSWGDSLYSALDSMAKSLMGLVPPPPDSSYMKNKILDNLYGEVGKARAPTPDLSTDDQEPPMSKKASTKRPGVTYSQWFRETYGKRNGNDPTYLKHKTDDELWALHLRGEEAKAALQRRGNWDARRVASAEAWGKSKSLKPKARS